MAFDFPGYKPNKESVRATRQEYKLSKLHQSWVVYGIGEPVAKHPPGCV